MLQQASKQGAGCSIHDALRDVVVKSAAAAIASVLAFAAVMQKQMQAHIMK